ncbi:MAG: hypothetical protein M3O01_15675 [Pseudomonadota bacterium]|nr:hypothetical protein [Pseudomonadota bacterium]
MNPPSFHDAGAGDASGEALRVAEMARRDTDPAIAPLTFKRSVEGAGGHRPPLGGRWVGRHPEALGAPLLAPEGAVFDGWHGAASVREGRHGCVRFVTDGHWMHGLAEVDERDCAADGGLVSAARRAYLDLFDVLARQGCPHLLRLWNYFPDINQEREGSERYRQFNAGRQQAFIDAGRSPFEGAPAASALGTRSGPLRIYFLAGQHAPAAIENPRQVSAYHYPHAYGPRSPTFSRAALVTLGPTSDALFISGTASIVGHATLHAGDVGRQTAESLRNIDALLQEAARRSGLQFPLSELICTLYVRHVADVGIVRDVFERFVGAGNAAARQALYLQMDICRADLLVEIEAHGVLCP